MALQISRKQYAALYGPTTGDRVRLADTELVIEVERDYTFYGDEITFGGGKVIRDGMGQSSRATREGVNGALVTTITRAATTIRYGSPTFLPDQLTVDDGALTAPLPITLRAASSSASVTWRPRIRVAPSPRAALSRS